MGWKQIVCITTLALLVGQSESVNTTTTQAPTTASTTTGPPIHYTCSMDGTVTIRRTGTVASNHRIAIGQNKDESSVLSYNNADLYTCQYTESTPNSKDITLTNCTTNSSIYVYLMDQNSSNVVGGKNNHAYELNCYFPKDGIQMEVSAAPISVKPPDAYSNETHEFDLGNIGLTMTITPNLIHLGDKLSLSISDKKDLYVLPMNCTATEGGTGKESQKLLTNGEAVNVNLLENFVIADNGSAVAAMYAFRFKSSDEVRVTCTVTICKTKDCGGIYATPPPVGGKSRRRRSVKEATPGRTYDVSAAFEILENEPNESSSSPTSVRVNPLLTGLSLLCLWAVASSKTS